jgi:hypothetical protein
MKSDFDPDSDIQKQKNAFSYKVCAHLDRQKVLTGYLFYLLNINHYPVN